MRPVSVGKLCYRGEKLGSVWRAQGAIASISLPLAWPVKSFRALPSYLSLLPLPLLPRMCELWPVLAGLSATYPAPRLSVKS